MPLNDSYESIYERANMLVSNNQWEQAIDEYKRIFVRLGKLSPSTRAKHPELAGLFQRTIFDLIALLNRIEEHDQAIELMQQLIEIEPDNQTLWRREIARYRIQQGEVEQGLAELHALSDEETEQPFTEITLGEAYLQIKAYDEAIAHLSKAIQLAESAKIPEVQSVGYRYLFDVYAQMGDAEKAIQVWQMASRFDESLDSSLAVVYEMYLEHGDTDGVRALTIRDQDPVRRGFYRGMVHWREDDLAEARQQWERVVRRDIDEESENIECWMEAGLRLGQANRVIDQATPLLSAGQSNLKTALLFAAAWAMLGETDHADSFLKMVRENLLWKRNDKFTSGDWQILDELIDDETVKSALRHHFEDAEETTESPSATISHETDPHTAVEKEA